MKEDVVRVQLFFHLDDPEERAVYEFLCSGQFRKKTQAVCELYRKAQIGEEQTAERIAALVIAGLSQTRPPKASVKPQQAVTGEKRKRGRPRKIRPAEPAQSVNQPPIALEQTNQTSSQSYQAPASTVQEAAVDNQTSTGLAAPDGDLLPDDDMLASMSAFVG